MSKTDYSRANYMRNANISCGSISHIFNDVDRDVFKDVINKASAMGCTTVAEYLREMVLEDYFNGESI
jgi:hypothetical protein